MKTNRIDQETRKEIAGKTLRLTFHMTTEFSPELDQPVRTALMSAFREYWYKKIDLESLQERLGKIGFTEGIQANGFSKFLNAEDVH